MAMQVLALSVLQADITFSACASGWVSVVLSKVPQLNWSAWTGVELKCALPSGNTVEWVCVCLNHVSTPYPCIDRTEMFLRQFNPPEFAIIITPTCSEKQVGNLIFTILLLQMTLCLFIGQRIITWSLLMSQVMPYGGRSQQDTASIRQGRKDCSGTLIKIKKIVWQDDCNSREETGRGLQVHKVGESHLL